MIPYMAAFLPSIFHTMAIWLTVYLAIQRYIYICVPSLVRKFCTIHRSKQVRFRGSFFSNFFSIRSYLPLYLSPPPCTPRICCRFTTRAMMCMTIIEIVNNPQCRHLHHFFLGTITFCYRHRSPFMAYLTEDIYYKMMFSTQTIFVHLIPSVLLVIFTWKLVGAIRVADRRHANLLSKYSSNTRSARRKFSELTNTSENENKLIRLFKQRDSVSVGNEPRRAHGLKQVLRTRCCVIERKSLLQNTRMLIVVILLFLITEIPAALIFTIHVLSVSLKFSFVNYQFLNVLLIVR